jgi:hypothetical protein
MIITAIAPYQESSSLDPDPSCDFALTNVRNSG